MLTSLEILNRQFKKEFRGYDPKEVDEFAALIARDFEALSHENMELREMVERLNTKMEHYQHMESTLQSTLVIAQETAEEVKLNAKREGELLVKEVEIRNQRLTDETSAKLRKMMSEYEEIRKQTQMHRIRLKTMLTAQLEMLKRDEEDEN